MGKALMGDDGYYVHLSTVRREISDDQYRGLMSVLSGETVEEWVARRLAEGKPISPTGEEKQD